MKNRQTTKNNRRTINAEGGELIQTPDGALSQLLGNSHSNGGMDVNVPEGSIVFSDFLEVDGETLAERKLNRERRLKKATPKEKTYDIFTRNAIERILETNLVEEYEDVMKQEVERAKESYKKGGTVSPEKAKKILHEGKVHGKPLTDKQRKFFGAMSNYQLGGIPGSFLEGLMGMLNAPQQGQQVIDSTILQRADAPEPNMFNDFLANLTNSILATQAAGQGAQEGVGAIGDLALGAMQGAGDVLNVEPNVISGGVAKAVQTAGGLSMGPLGLALGAAGPLATTILNRIGDKRNKNFFEDFGRDALNSNQQAARSAAGQLEQNKAENVLATQDQLNLIGNTASSPSVQRSLSQSAIANRMRSNNQASVNYNNQITNILGQRSQLQNQRDQTVMAGRERAFEKNQQDRDQFFTNLNSDIRNVAQGLMFGDKIKPSTDVIGMLGLDFLK